MSSNSSWWSDYDNYEEKKTMKWSDKGGEGMDFEPAPAGNNIGICYMVLDLGTHYNEMYDNWRHQCFIGFELPAEIRTWKDKEGKEQSAPFTVGEFYTTSLNEKANLRKHLESWRGRPFTEDELEGFDSRNILGKPAMVNVIHTLNKKGNKKAKISSISPPVKGMPIPTAVHDQIFFSLDKEDFSHEAFEKLPDGFKDIVQRSKEWQALHSQDPAEQDDVFVDDEIPDFTGKADDIPF
jgi:hypothetical protein